MSMFERALNSNAVPSVSAHCTQEITYQSHFRPVHRLRQCCCKHVALKKPEIIAVGSRARDRLTVKAAAEGTVSTREPFGAGSIREIPVFPLGIVAFPTADVPLNIFEARYRVLFSTLLAGSEGIDEDLVNDQKPWSGSRLFGMCYVNSERGGMAAVGTTLHIENHERLPDGRLFIISKGVEKFRVLRVIEERPVMVCQVEMLEDKDSHSPQIEAAAKEVVQLFKDLVQLNIRMQRLQSSEAAADPNLDDMTPREVSYWLALIFGQSPLVQQALLEEADVDKRILQEKEILEGTIKFLRAKVALQSAFASDVADTTTSSSNATDSLQDSPEGAAEPQRDGEQSPKSDPPQPPPSSGPD